MRNRKGENYEIFKEVAHRLIESMKTPTVFLQFLTESLTWVRNYELKATEEEKNRNVHFNLIVIIEEVVQPWIKSSDKNKVEKVSKGLFNVIDFMGAEGMKVTNDMLIKAFGQEVLNVGVPSKKGFIEYADRIHDMLDIQQYFEIFDHNMEREKLAA